jgi:beta-lactamase superfamily II metal-dependent hydrolase
MAIEVEFLPVGEKSCAGDAIVIRYGQPGAYGIMLVDGGVAETGDQIVTHIRQTFGAQSYINHMVLTHSDQDHASGLRTVLREMHVEHLWLHIPWHFAAEARQYFRDKRWTDQGLADAIKKEYDIIAEIVDLANAQNTTIHYPFEGDQIGPFTVMSPTRYAYVRLLPQFGKTPDPDQDALEAESWWIGKAPVGAAKAFVESIISKVSKWVGENWALETLRDNGLTSASNESSVVLYAQSDDRRYLLTGDAGRWALTWAAGYADRAGLPLQAFNCVQIPHHGSRRNVGPTILNRLLGPTQPAGTEKFLGYASVPKDDDKHPRKVVMNAFTRRGGSILITAGSKAIFYGGFPKRDGYGPGQRQPMHTVVEGYED